MYIALKSVKFDKDYAKGEKITKEVIAPDMIVKLIRCGVIQKVEETGELLKEKAEADEPETDEQSEEETKAEKAPKEKEVEEESLKEKAKTSKQPKKV